MNICTLGESLKLHKGFLGNVASPQWVAANQLEPITSLHYFPLTQDQYRAISCVQSQGIYCTKSVFKNHLFLVTDLTPWVTAHNLLLLCKNPQVT